MRHLITNGSGIRVLLACISVIAVSLIVAGKSAARIDLKSVIVAYLFDEDPGDTVTDFSGNGNDGVLTNVDWVDEGKTGGGLKFNGANSKLVSATANNVGNKAFSECLWITFDDVSTEAQFAYISCTGTNNARYFYFSSWSSAGAPHDSLHCGTLDTAGAWGRGISTGRLFKDDTWYFVAGVVDTEAGFIKVYVDGALVMTQAIGTGDTPGDPAEIWIGGSPENYQWINGTVDDLAIFNVALSEEQINNIMRNGLAAELGLTAVEPSDKLPATWGQLKQ